MNRKSHTLLFLILILVLLNLIIHVNRTKYTSTSEANQEITYQIYTVQPGDSLWGISKQYVNGDPRELIYQIRKLNNISPNIYPGQSLKIPLK
jgi:LysM repeat protein